MASHIACSPLTGSIHAGPVNKAGTAFVGVKKDVTSEVLRAVIEKAQFHGGCFDIQCSDGSSYVVAVTKVSSPKVAQCTQLEQELTAQLVYLQDCIETGKEPAMSGPNAAIRKAQGNEA